MNLSKDYADFIQQFQWNYFATCRTPYKIHTMTVRNWLTKLLNSSNKVGPGTLCVRERQGRLQ